jgi:hypothetical protein
VFGQVEKEPIFPNNPSKLSTELNLHLSPKIS